MAILIYALISYFMDVAWRLTVKNYPIYKRHLAIFGLLLLFIVTQEWYLLLTLNLKSSNWLMGVIGVMIGLGFSSLPFILGSRNPAYGWMLGSNKRNDPSRRLVIVADFHWEEEEGLSGLQQVTLAMPDADWLFLGDIFNIWIGIKGYETLAQRNFIWWVSERRRTGHWVGLWLGNREYFLDDLADKFDFIGEGVNGTLEGEPFAFEHGDLINPNDRHYRFWNLVSRSGFTWLLGKIIPSFIRRRLVLYLVEKLQTTNEAYKTEFPKDEFQNAAYESGAPFLITGHFHTLEKFEKGMSIPWAREGKLLIWQNDEFNVVDSKFQ
ncbi:MAG: hypothetical protein LBH03_02630 [Holophagales bacterium]|nr:hypothetical protein [Holophagales bacterium]